MGVDEVLRPPAVLVDMDGTLCDVRSIRYLVDGSPGRVRPRNFHAFHSASIDCPAHQSVVDIIQYLRGAGLGVLVVSAREARWGFLTALWLGEHEVTYDEMFLRENGDYRPDVEVKYEIATRLMQQFRPVLAIDDRADVISVWQSRGIPTMQVMEDGVIPDEVAPMRMALDDYLTSMNHGSAL